MRFNNYLKSLDNDYAFIKKFAKPRNKICGVTIDDLTFLPYKILKKKIPELFEEQKFEEAIHLILKHYKKNITFIRVKIESNKNKFLFILWIHKQFKMINDTEARYLVSPPDMKLLQAGIKELDILGDINTIDALAEGNVLNWEKVEMLPYERVFNKLLKNTNEARVNKKLVEINKQK